MYNQQQENYNIWKDPNGPLYRVSEDTQQTQHDPAKWLWIEDDCPSALVDLLTTEISVQNDLKPQQL